MTSALAIIPCSVFGLVWYHALIRIAERENG